MTIPVPVPVSQFPATGALTGSEVVPVVKNGVTSRTTTQDIADLGSGAVASVNGQTGVVVLDAADVGAVPVAALPLDITMGGTGQITASAALNALLPDQTGQGGKTLGTDGANVSWVAGGGGAVDSVNGQTGVVVLTAADVGAEPAASTGSWLGNFTGFTGVVQQTVFYVIANGLCTLYVKGDATGVKNGQGEIVLDNLPPAVLPAAFCTCPCLVLNETNLLVPGSAGVDPLGTVALHNLIIEVIPPTTQWDLFISDAFEDAFTAGILAGWTITYPL